MGGFGEILSPGCKRKNVSISEEALRKLQLERWKSRRRINVDWEQGCHKHVYSCDPSPTTAIWGGSIPITGSATSLRRFRAVDYAAAKHAVLGFGRGLVPLLETAQLPIRVNILAPSWADSRVLLPSLKSLLASIDIEVQAASVVSRCAAYLMVDSSKNGQLIYVQHGRCMEVDESVLLPAYEEMIKGIDFPSEDEVLKRLILPEVSAASAVTWSSSQHKR